MSATLDLIGLYNYNQDLLSELTLPEEIEDKRQILIENLLLDTAELEVIYPDPSFMQKAIGIWSKKQSPIWKELYDTTQYEYNPIWNKDGVIKEKRSESEGVSDNNTMTNNLQDKQTRNTQDKETRDLDGNVKNKVTGFNSSTESPSDSSYTEDNGTDTYNHTGTITDDHTGTQKNERQIKRNAGESTERTEQGNIGLTSTQQLIQEQREVVKLNILDYIINEFKQRFCLKVY